MRPFYPHRASLAGPLLASLFLLSLGTRWAHDLWLHKEHCHATAKVCDTNFHYSSDKAHFHSTSSENHDTCPYAFAGFLKYYDLHRPDDGLQWHAHPCALHRQVVGKTTVGHAAYSGASISLRGPPTQG